MKSDLDALPTDGPAELKKPWIVAVGKKVARTGASCIPFAGAGGLLIGHPQMQSSVWVIMVNLSVTKGMELDKLGDLFGRLEDTYAHQQCVMAGGRLNWGSCWSNGGHVLVGLGFGSFW